MGLKQGISTLLIVAALAMPMNAALCEENVYAGQTVTTEETISQAGRSDCYDYSGNSIHAHVYVNDRGRKKEFRSEELIIGNYKWTPEFREIKFTDSEFTEPNLPDTLSEGQLFLYYGNDEKSGLLLFSPKTEADGVFDSNSGIVVSVSEEEKHILEQLKIFRADFNLGIYANVEDRVSQESVNATFLLFKIEIVDGNYLVTPILTKDHKTAITEGYTYFYPDLMIVKKNFNIGDPLIISVKSSAKEVDGFVKNIMR